MDAAFLSPAAPPICLGLRLRPLTLGHLALLAEIESPFVDGRAAGPTLEDLFAAVFICADSYPRSRRHLSAWWRDLFFWVWTRRCRRRDLRLDAARFQNYLRAAQTCPEMRAAQALDARPTELAAPRHWQLLARLMHDFGLSLEEGLAMPVSQANALLVTLAELEGRVELVGPRMQWLRDFAREQERSAEFIPPEDRN